LRGFYLGNCKGVEDKADKHSNKDYGKTQGVGNVEIG
jgi:hypothetical protein